MKGETKKVTFLLEYLIINGQDLELEIQQFGILKKTQITKKKGENVIDYGARYQILLKVLTKPQSNPRKSENLDPSLAKNKNRKRPLWTPQSRQLWWTYKKSSHRNG